MKLAVLILALICAPIAHAQETEPTQLAQIDPAALNLLARMSWKYRHTTAYETYINITRSDQPKSGDVVRRLRLNHGAFIWSEKTPDQNWRKWIYNGAWAAVAFDSRFPKRYLHWDFVYVASGDNSRFKSILNSLNVTDAMLPSVLSGEWPADLVVHPSLNSISTATEDDFKVVTLKFVSSPFNIYGAPSRATWRLWIEPQTLLLRRLESSETVGDNQKSETFVRTENYEQTRFEPNFDNTDFTAAAPLSYRLLLDPRGLTLSFPASP